jgi:fumarylpyruvate hydrolase
MTMNYTHPAKTISIPVKGTDKLFPVTRIYCVGRNYVAHAQEMGFTGREPPFFFMKPADALVIVAEGEVGQMHYPSLTKDLHHEIELVACIGKGGKNIKAADAMKHIYGYAVGLDMTRRDLQGEQKKLGRPWDIGKGFDESAPISHIVPADQAGDVINAAIHLSVNGKTTQTSHISNLIWNMAETIEHLSAAWELQPGDLIYTGTPEGVAAVVQGDLLVGSVAGVGELKIKVV